MTQAETIMREPAQGVYFERFQNVCIALQLVVVDCLGGDPWQAGKDR
jgi:hypothetical protein